MRVTMILVVLSALLFSVGCKKNYDNPNIVDPANAKKIYARDDAFCRQWAEDQYNAGKTRTLQDDLGATVSDYEDDFARRINRDEFYKSCMTQRGWNDASW